MINSTLNYSYLIEILEAVLNCVVKNDLCLVKKCYQQNVFSYHKYLIYIDDLHLNNLQWLVCHKTQPNQILSNFKGGFGIK